MKAPKHRVLARPNKSPYWPPAVIKLHAIAVKMVIVHCMGAREMPKSVFMASMMEVMPEVVKKITKLVRTAPAIPWMRRSSNVESMAYL